MAETLSRTQRQTLAARQAFRSTFESQEARSAHYRSLGQKSAAGRVVLPVEDARALVETQASLSRLTEIVGRIADRVERHAASEVAQPPSSGPMGAA